MTQHCAFLSLVLYAHSVATGAALQKSYFPDYSIYHSYQRYKQHLFDIVDRHSSVLALETSDLSTHRGEPLYLLKLTSARPHTYRKNGSKIKKPLVLVTFGEHPRELVSVESFFDLVQNITNGYESGCQTWEGRYSKYILDHLELHFVGLLNPDGKMMLEETKDYCFRHNANHVDINRNADWNWGGSGSSGVKGSEEYRGPHVFSEVESQYLRDQVNKHNYLAYWSIHSGERQLFAPFVDSGSVKTQPHRTRPQTQQDLMLLSSMTNASNGWIRNFGQASYMNFYQADGTLADWVAGKTNVDYVMTAEIWGGPFEENCFCQFNPESKHLQNDLALIRPLYLNGFEQLIERHTGSSFKSFTRRKQWLTTLCEEEQQLKKLLA